MDIKHHVTICAIAKTRQPGFQSALEETNPCIERLSADWTREAHGTEVLVVHIASVQQRSHIANMDHVSVNDTEDGVIGRRHIAFRYGLHVESANLPHRSIMEQSLVRYLATLHIVRITNASQTILVPRVAPYKRVKTYLDSCTIRRANLYRSRRKRSPWV